MAKASLAEIMGKKGAEGGKLTLSNLREVLGDTMPEIPHDAVGRHRLVVALKQRFGDNFRNIPGVIGLLAEFDENCAFEQKLHSMRSIKYAPKKKEK